MPTLILQKYWNVKAPNPQLQVEISDALKVHPIVAQLLINRNIQSVEEARNFLDADISNLHDPFLLKDMDKAVQRVKAAKKNKENVLIFGDYDVDGVTSTCILHHTLKKFGIKTINYIPHRFHDGYGLNAGIGEIAKKQGVSLILVIDSGITAHDEVDIINKLGIDVVIFDHHVPSDGPLPKATAIVNPKRKDCTYPFKQLASVGLAAKFTEALLGELNEEELDLVAIGTIADIVPLRDENRIYVKHGLPKIEKTTNKGLQALLEVARIRDKKFQPHYVGFIIGPRLNASGRMDSAQKSLELLLSKNVEEALALAKSLETLNSQRQKLQNNMIQDALSIVERDINFNDHKVIVISKEDWHKGVLGIVASRLAETYYRPSVVISLDEEGTGTASARSIAGFHLHDALTHCSETLERFGGHKGAAGLTIKEENIESFKDMINEYAEDNIESEQLAPSIEIDCEVPLSALSLETAEYIASMEPFGEGNPAPVFCTRRLQIKAAPVVMGKETLKLWVTDGKISISAIGFRMGKYKDHLVLGQYVDLAYQLTVDDWNKAPTAQLKLKDIRLT